MNIQASFTDLPNFEKIIYYMDNIVIHLNYNELNELDKSIYDNFKNTFARCDFGIINNLNTHELFRVTSNNDINQGVLDVDYTNMSNEDKQIIDRFLELTRK